VSVNHSRSETISNSYSPGDGKDIYGKPSDPFKGAVADMDRLEKEMHAASREIDQKLREHGARSNYSKTSRTVTINGQTHTITTECIDGNCKTIED
jgi:hypothetical protein